MSQTDCFIGVGATTTPCYITVDNPNQDLFNGFIAFFFVLAFIIWLFRR